jgi:hypothetical protein
MQQQLYSTTATLLPSSLSLADAGTRQEMAALSDEELAIIHLDIPFAVARLRSALPDLREVEAALRSRLRKPPVGRVDRLERYAAVLLETCGMSGVEGSTS